jgi:hypothetical protein
MSDNYEEQMLRRLDQTFAPAWKPDPNDVGLFAFDEGGTVPAGEYAAYPVLTGYRVVNGHVTSERLAVHCMHTALKQSVERDYPDRGNVFAVRYNGKRVNDRTGRTFDSYDYRVDRNPPDSMRAEYEKVLAADGGAPGSGPSSMNYDEPF